MVETETATLWHIINTHCFASQTHEMLKSNRPCSVAIFLLSEKDAVSTCLCSSVLFRSRGFLLLRTQPLPAGLRGGECVCVCVCGWVSLCGCGCVSQKAVHTTNTFHCIHTLPTSVNSVFTFYYCQTSKITKFCGLHTYTQSGESSYLPFTMADIRQSDLPPCIIHISGTCKEVIKHYTYVSTLCLYSSLLCMS